MQNSEIKIYVLGTASAIAVDHRQHTALLIEAGSSRIVFDCGIPLVQTQHRMNCTGKIDAIFISHMHTDHCGLLAGTVKQMQLQKNQDEIHIYGPTGIQTVFDQVLPLLYVFDTPEYASCVFHDIKNSMQAGDFTVCSCENRHLSKEKYIERNRQNPGILTGSYSFTAEYRGIKIGYTADIDSIEICGDFFNGCSVLFCEAEHISAENIESYRQQQKIGKIILVHYAYKKIAETKQVFYAGDGDIFTASSAE